MSERMTLLYTSKPCGCLVLVLVNDARNLIDCARDIAQEAREGRTLHETTKEALPPFTCAEHLTTRYANAVVSGQREMGL